MHSVVLGIEIDKADIVRAVPGSLRCVNGCPKPEGSGPYCTHHGVAFSNYDVSKLTPLGLQWVDVLWRGEPPDEVDDELRDEMLYHKIMSRASSWCVVHASSRPRVPDRFVFGIPWACEREGAEAFEHLLLFHETIEAKYADLQKSLQQRMKQFCLLDDPSTKDRPVRLYQV